MQKNGSTYLGIPLEKLNHKGIPTTSKPFSKKPLDLSVPEGRA